MPDDPDLPRVTISMPRELLQQIDDLRFSRRIASRAEAIRQLLEAALKTKPQP